MNKFRIYRKIFRKTIFFKIRINPAICGEPTANFKYKIPQFNHLKFNKNIIFYFFSSLIFLHTIFLFSNCVRNLAKYFKYELLLTF